MRLVRALLLSVLVCATALAQKYNIYTFAGGGFPNAIPATSVRIPLSGAAAVDSFGNVYVAATFGNVVCRIDVTTGNLTPVAGNGAAGYSGDNGPALQASLNGAAGVAVDSSGNLYIADTMNHVVRKVSNGVITTFAGNGSYGRSGDNGPAASAQRWGPQGVAVDTAGDVYIADTRNNVIRKVSGGIIATIAGTGTAGHSGDNGPATSATLAGPVGLALDAAGDLYIADVQANVIRLVSNGIITTFAGNGFDYYAVDNIPATSAAFNKPTGVAVDAAGNVYIADTGNHGDHCR